MISIIIPVYNVESYLDKVISHILQLKGDFEIIAVDGGSTDDSLKILHSYPDVRVFQSPKSRSLQMNEGAKHANGEILLFLHADTLLPENGITEIQNAMKDPHCSGGSFYLTFDRNNWLLSLYSMFSKINHSLFTYGDQAIFCRKPVFRKIGAYKEIPLMEDVEIQFRLRKTGKFIKLPTYVRTSARRFIRNGVIRQMVVDIGLVLLYRMGVSPFWLKQFYLDK